MKHRSGFCAITGKPNAGKSTLMNRIIGTSLSAVTPKAQTTRHRIKGILNDDDYQIVFSDTPGLLTPAYLLHEKMTEAIKQSCEDADVVLLVTDCTEKPDDAVVDFLKSASSPLVIALNKADLSTQTEVEQRIIEYRHLFPAATIIPISAQENFNIRELVEAILSHLPEGEAFYSKEELSDRNQRFFAEEIIREQIFLYYEKEIPYSAEVAVTHWQDKESLIKMDAVIFVLRETQKAILLGHKGSSIKRMATAARKKLESFTGRKVFLELTVKVNPKWRTDESMLKRLGYDEH
ncbi:MAG: GTPase Era [Bacteroidia bacterium]|nr:GTPase Era [Bacteroidia bacterium]